MDHARALDIDVYYYLRSNPDLSHFSSEAAYVHYVENGRREGRAAAAMAKREGIRELLLDSSLSTLEIGPFFSPLVSGANVSYLDILSADELRARAALVGGDPNTCPTTIHYVGGIEQVDRKFDVVVSCHAIEHQPDLVRHLQGVANVLKPGGRYLLIVPDKRFCLDHFLAESTIADVLQAHLEKRVVHTLKSVIDQCAFATHNDPGRHWAGDHGDIPVSDRPRRVREALDLFDSADGGYVDVHAWYFVPERFREICEVLQALDLSTFAVEAVYETVRDRAEFCAILRAPS